MAYQATKISENSGFMQINKLLTGLAIEHITTLFYRSKTKRL